MSDSSLLRRMTPLVVAGTVLLGVVTATAASADATPVAHSANNARVTSRTLYGTVNVTSSKHKKLSLSLSASPTSANGGSSTVSVTASNGTESHDWSFRVPKSKVKAGHGNGKITLSKKASHRFAVVKLTFSKAGKTKGNKCAQSTDSTVKGILYLNTKAAWGKLGSKRHTMKFKGSESDTLSGSCHQAFPCTPGSTWNAYGSNNGPSIFGGTAGRRGYVYASRYVQLGKWGDRNDFISTRTKRPTLHGSGAHAVYTVKASGVAHGKLVIRSQSKPTSQMQSCKHNGKKTHETSYNYYTVKVSSTFAVHAQIYGSMKAPKQGSFTVTKLG